MLISPVIFTEAKASVSPPAQWSQCHPTSMQGRRVGGASERVTGGAFLEEARPWQAPGSLAGAHTFQAAFVSATFYLSGF